jgi:hypothetical protein
MIKTTFLRSRIRTTVVCVFFTATMALTFNLQAQTFNGGAKAAIVVSQIAGDGFSGFNKAGVNAGFFVQYQWSSAWSAQMDLAYIQKGSAQKLNPDDPSSYSYLLRLNYVELPLVLQYHLAPLVLEVGISLDFLAGYFEEIDYQINDQGEAWKKMNVNSVIGVQYQLNERWIVSIRSINSITSLRKNSIPLNVRRYGTAYGAYNDAISVGLLFRM